MSLNLTEKQQLWHPRIMECRESGLSDNEWCKLNGFATSSLYYYVKNLQAKACEVPLSKTLHRQSKQEVVQLKVVDEVPASGFNKVAEPSSMQSFCTEQAALRLHLNGISIDILNGADELTIQHTIHALRFLC